MFIRFSFFKPLIYSAYSEWPQKLFTVSYILYPFMGGLITTTVGVIVGILTGGTIIGFCNSS